MTLGVSAAGEACASHRHSFAFHINYGIFVKNF